MKYVTFNQALLAVGLVGLVVALNFLEGNSFAIAASLLVDDGPSIAGPVVLMAVSLAIPLATLAACCLRMGSESGDNDPAPLSYAQARLIIGLAGLILLAAVAPQVIVAGSVAEWEGSAIDSIAYLVVGLIVSAAILGSALASVSRDATPIDRSQLLMCLGLTVLVVVVVVAPALAGFVVTGAEDAPELTSFPAETAFRVFSGVSLALMLAVLPGLLFGGATGTRWALAFSVLFVGVAASVNLVYALAYGLPLMVLVATSYVAGRDGAGAPGPIRSGSLLAAIGLLSLAISVSSTKYVISLYHACSPYDASLYLWPTLALVVAVVFSLGILGAGLRKLREGPVPADEAWGE